MFAFRPPRKTPSGWLIAAPLDRGDYVRPGQVNPDLECTDFVEAKTLVVRVVEDAPNLGGGEAKGGKKRKKGAAAAAAVAGPDFRKFKKNSTMQNIYEMITDSTSVLPKETERELQLQTQNAAMERAQVEAEALFTQAGKAMKGVKGMTMDSFVSQAPGATQKGKRGTR